MTLKTSELEKRSKTEIAFTNDVSPVEFPRIKSPSNVFELEVVVQV